MAVSAPLVEGVAVIEGGNAGGEQGGQAEKEPGGWQGCLGRQKCTVFASIAAAAIVIAAVALAVALTNREGSDADGGTTAAMGSIAPAGSFAPSPQSTTVAAPNADSSHPPSTVPTAAPTAVPTTARFQALKDVIVQQNISEATSLSDPAAPQYAALSWLADEDVRSVSPEHVPAVVQRYILAVFYFSTGGEGWTESSGFLSGSHECDDWFGVICHINRDVVGAISMGENNLTGTLPSEIGVLPLQVLRLDTNRIRGTIPESFRLLGESVTTISLVNNRLASTIPDIFEDLPNLNYFDVGINELTGELPTTLNGRWSMRHFWANSNFLSGKVDIDFSLLPSIKYLSLWGNLLSGTIPESVGVFHGTLLYLGENAITGTIPEESADMPNIELLGLWDMMLNGTIPSGLFGMENLIAVGVGGNKLTGTLPNVENGARTSLRALGFERNSLTGSIPSSFGNLASLEGMLGHSNSLEGSIPEEIGNNVKLRVLDLGRNRLSAKVPASFSQLVNLEWLSLKQNDLTGSIDFLCDLALPIIASDCGGKTPQIECECCALCCHPEEANCGIFLDTAPLIKIVCDGSLTCSPEDY